VIVGDPVKIVNLGLVCVGEVRIVRRTRGSQ
jgi:hypothetical protein